MLKVLCLSAASLLLSACATPDYIRFTQEFRDSEGFTEQDIKHLQFFVCPELVIEREVRLNEKGIKSGRLISKQGRMINQVVIPAWTPGIAVNSADHYLAVSFEEGTALAYGVERGVFSGDYAILGKNGEAGFQVMYDGAWYDMVELGEDDHQCEGSNFGEARLWIDAASLKEVTTRRKVLKGRTIE